MIVPVTFTGSVVVVPCFLSVELGWANASGAISKQPRVTITFFIVRLPLLMVCSAAGVSGCDDHPTRATSCVSHSPLFAALARSKCSNRASSFRANLLVDPRKITASLAEIYALTGEADEAFRPLDHLLQVPNGLTVLTLKLDPACDPLRKDPRSQALMDKYAVTR